MSSFLFCIMFCRFGIPSRVENTLVHYHLPQLIARAAKEEANMLQPNVQINIATTFQPMERSQSFLLVTSRLIDASNSICQFDAATPGSGRLYKASRSLEQASVSSSKLSKMDQLTLSASKLVSALVLLLACVAAHFGAVSAQYGNSAAAGTGPADGAGYLLLAVAAFVWT